MSLGNIPRKNLLRWPGFLIQLIVVFYQSFVLLHRHRPEKVVSMGGYISVPVCLTARLLKIPVELYELNVVPGAAVKFLSSRADVVRICFEHTRDYLPRAQCVKGEYPLRYTDVNRLERDQACMLLGISSEKKIILVLGGSQGSRFINELMQHYAAFNRNYHTYSIIHQTGAADVESVRSAYQHKGVDALVFSYRTDIHLCYSAADVVVARAGAALYLNYFFLKNAH